MGGGGARERCSRTRPSPRTPASSLILFHDRRNEKRALPAPPSNQSIGTVAAPPRTSFRQSGRRRNPTAATTMRAATGVLLRVGVVTAAVAALQVTFPSAGVLPLAGSVLLGLLKALAVLAVVVPLLAFSPLALPFRALPEGRPRRGIVNDPFRPRKVADGEWDAVVVGSGMGGLSCAATLTRFGKRVLVLEQHDVAGGGTHSFSLPQDTDYTFDSGLHYTVPQSGELLQLACGTRRKPVEFALLGEPDGCFDKVVLGDVKQDGFRVKHKQAHLDTLRDMFPAEKDRRELDEFLRVATAVNNRFPLWLLSKAMPRWARRVFKWLFLQTFTRYAAQTGEAVTTRLVSNPKMAALLCGLWMDAGCPPDRATFMMTAALSVGFPKEGGAYPTGGARGMATCLVQAVEGGGGKVLVRARVDEILVEGGAARGVRLRDGTVVHAPLVVSACGFSNTYTRLLPAAAVPPAYATVDTDGHRALPPQLRDSLSWVMANLGLRADPAELGIGCTNVWVQPCTEANGWNLFEGVKSYFAAEDPLKEPVIPMMITFPSLKDRACTAGADHRRLTCQILALARREWFAEWESESGKHPLDGSYSRLKQRWRDRLLGQLIRRYPRLFGKTTLVDLSTPLSIQWFLNKPGGGAVGLDLTPARFSDPAVEDLLDMRTPVRGLWLTGEDSLLCGQPLAQLSGVITAWRIVGLWRTLSFVLWIVRLALSDALGLK